MVAVGVGGVFITCVVIWMAWMALTDKGLAKDFGGIILFAIIVGTGGFGLFLLGLILLGMWIQIKWWEEAPPNTWRGRARDARKQREAEEQARIQKAKKQRETKRRTAYIDGKMPWGELDREEKAWANNRQKGWETRITRFLKGDLAWSELDEGVRNRLQREHLWQLERPEVVEFFAGTRLWADLPRAEKVWISSNIDALQAEGYYGGDARARAFFRGKLGWDDLSPALQQWAIEEQANWQQRHPNIVAQPIPAANEATQRLTAEGKNWL